MKDSLSAFSETNIKRPMLKQVTLKSTLTEKIMMSVRRKPFFLFPSSRQILKSQKISTEIEIFDEFFSN